MSAPVWELKEEHLSVEAWEIGLDGLREHAKKFPQALPTDPGDALVAAMLAWAFGAWAIDTNASGPPIRLTLGMTQRIQYTMLSLLDWPAWWPVSVSAMRQAYAEHWHGTVDE